MQLNAVWEAHSGGDEMRIALAAITVLWLAIYGMAYYGFGLDGILAGLDRRNYGPGEAVDFYIHWLLVLFPVFALAAVLLSTWARRTRS
jgi:hypothetical protein